jgi:hypothetical protein
VTNAVISASDSVLVAFGKLQAQITANLSTLTSHTSNTSNPHATTKAQVGLGNADNTSDANKPVSTATQTALNAKQDTLVSNTNIKTVNSTTLLGSGDIAVQPTLVSGTSIKTVNSNSLLGAGDVAVQPTLVSGTNIKTLNSVSLLGSGDIVLAATPSGISGAIQFSDGSAFASDAINFFWDNTNKRLGIGQSIPTARIHIQGSSAATTSSSLLIFNSTPTEIFRIRDNGNVQIGATTDAGFRLDVNGTARISNDLTVGSSTQKINLGQFGSIQSLTAANVFLKFESNNVVLSSQNGINFKTGNANSGFSVVVNSGCVVGTGSELSMNASAKLQVDSTTRGLLPPRMTTTQKNAIATPAAGLIVYDTTLNVLTYYNGTTWI